MRLSKALQINQGSVSTSGRNRKIYLACGFTPLHLETFVKAHTRLRFPGDEVTVVGGLFGDLVGNLVRARAQDAEGAIVVIEWADLDERLGFRASAGWGSDVLSDILQQVSHKIQRLEQGISELARIVPVAAAACTLPLPPLSLMPPVRSSSFELQLRCNLSGFLARLGATKRVRLVNDSTLARSSAQQDRHDIKTELHAGFPYTIPHAAAVAALAVECIFPAAPKKGLITDLDETLWKGILGDVGVSGISWSLDNHSQVHALYQQILASLAESGVLIGVASKNDRSLVQQAFERPDMLLKESFVFPIESHWDAKSQSVARILKVWNISADSVVFVDDSPMELAEVAEKHPGIECLQFPSDNPAGVLDLLHQLRARFGKAEIRDEDRLRLQSLRSSGALEQAESVTDPFDFLARLEAKIKMEFCGIPTDSRAFELVNKTNQFNLNGRRYSEGEWRQYFRSAGAFLATANYEDRFGPLGKIAVLMGRSENGTVKVDSWVMSCRAFSRHIEFQILARLYQKFGARKIEFAYQPTERNGPLQEFFGRFFPAGLPAASLELPIDVFERGRPQLFHQVTESSNG